MRKITFLFYALLFCCFGAAAQLKETTDEVESFPIEVKSLEDLETDYTGYVFSIKSGRNDAGAYLFSNGDNLCSNYSGNDDNNNYKNKDYSADNPEYQFVLYKASKDASTEGLATGVNKKAYYYIYSISAGKFIGTAGNKTAQFEFIPMTEDITNAIEIRELAGDNIQYRFLLSTNGECALNTSGTKGARNWGKKANNSLPYPYDEITNSANQYSFVKIKDIDSKLLKNVGLTVAIFELDDESLKNELKELLNKADAYLSAPEGAVGTPEVRDFEALKRAKEEVEEALLNKKNDISEKKKSLSNALNAIAKLKAIELDPNKYYRIISAYPKFKKENKIVAIEYNETFNINNTTTKYISWGYIDNSNVDAIFQIEENPGTEEGGYFIKHCNRKDYLTAVGGRLAKDKANVNFVKLDGAQYNLHFSNGKSGIADINSDIHNLKDYNNTDHGINTLAAWYIVPATDIEVSMNPDKEGNYWASTYLPFAVSTQDATILIGKNANDSYLTLEAVETLPAENGAILYIAGGGNDTDNEDINTVSEDNNADESSTVYCTLNIVDSSDAAATDGEIDNDLTGTLTELTMNGGNGNGYFVLGIFDREAGLYHPNGTTLKANKAYLEASAVPSNVNGLRFSFGEVTGIDNAAAERNTETGAVYDLSGRRVAAPVSGIYVKDGKKIFVR